MHKLTIHRTSVMASRDATIVTLTCPVNKRNRVTTVTGATKPRIMKNRRKNVMAASESIVASWQRVSSVVPNG
jgi:hypothetical protein